MLLILQNSIVQIRWSHGLWDISILGNTTQCTDNKTQRSRDCGHNIDILYWFPQQALTKCSWWRHQMETFSALLAIYAGNSQVPGEFPAQRPVTRSFDVFFDLRLNKRLSKQSWDWWSETISCILWRHRNVSIMHSLLTWLCFGTRACNIFTSIEHIHKHIEPKCWWDGSLLSFNITFTFQQDPHDNDMTFLLFNGALLTNCISFVRIRLYSNIDIYA